MQKKIIWRHCRPERDSVINQKQRTQRDDVRNARPSLGQPDAKKWSEIQTTQADYGDHGSRPLKRKHGKKILGEIVDDAESALGPMERNEILPGNIALSEPRVLDYLAQLHVVDHFHAQGAIRTDRFID